MVYFTHLLGKPVIDSRGRDIGVIKDLVFIDGDKYAEISYLDYLSKDNYRKKISWRFVKELKDESTKSKAAIGIYLNSPVEEINPLFEREDEFLVSKLIDKQIIDVDGLKVVRVNDVLLGKIKDKFSIVAVCVGTKSLIRRLGAEKIMGAVIPMAKENIIPWESVETLDPALQALHIKLNKSKIKGLHPGDIADIMEDLDYKSRALIFNSLDKSQAAKTIVEAEPHIQESFFKNMKVNRILEILEDLPTHDSADILSMMPKSRAAKLLSSMRQDVAEKIRKILSYPEESAGALMSTEFILVTGDFTAQKTINLLRKLKPSSEKTYHIYVIDENKSLIGILPIRALITAPSHEKVANLMKRRVVKVRLNTPKEEIANALSKYNLFAIPVVNGNNVLQGVVTADNVLKEVMPRSWKRKRYMPIKHKRLGNEKNI